MRYPILTLFLAVALAAAPACKSNRHSPPEYDPQAVACTCGEPAAQLDGCDHPLCLRGEGNPDNEDCVCGPLFEDGEG